MVSILLAALVAATPLERADQAYKAKDYEHARALYQTALKDSPSNAFAWYHLAVSDMKTGHDSEALDALRSFEKAASVPATAYTSSPTFSLFSTLPGFTAFVDELMHEQFPCRFDPAARAMDRWVGKWTVTNPAGAGGTSTIDRVFDGCMIEEHWTGDFGERGSSLTSYDSTTGHWRQHYVSDRAAVTDYVGTASGNDVVFIATGPQPHALTRMTYSFLSDGRVEQKFEASSDDGKTYSLTSDLYYAK
jgi:hypothetical protein